jgi:hypothetical protein
MTGWGDWEGGFMGDITFIPGLGLVTGIDMGEVMPGGRP